jgi:16S rRNA G527 N7-methylase RsmG
MSTSVSLSEILRSELHGQGELSVGQLEALERHYALLLLWNRRMNLTRVTALAEAATRHYCESLALAHYLSPGRIADVGSGAGFPGIPAAVARPDCQFDLIESDQRKAVFLREASRGLPNVIVRAERAEALGAEYDWVVSRGVDPEFVLRLGLAPQFALLVGESAASTLDGTRVIRLPWGDHRVIAVRVSRGADH